MKKHILLAITAVACSLTIQLKAGNKEKIEREPDRIEQKVFSGIKKVEIDHKYGNLTVKESKSKAIQLEIQYFDTKEVKASCEVVTKNEVLAIKTTNIISGNKKGESVKINYILSIPKNVALSTILKYGSMKTDKLENKFEANLSYGNLISEGFTGSTTPDIIIRYGSLTIGEVGDIKLIAAYSNVTITTAKDISLSGNYNNFKINKTATIKFNGSSNYNKYSIGTIDVLDTDMKYGAVSIDNLVTSIKINCAYTNIDIKASDKAKQINIDGAYSDVSVKLDAKVSATFESDIKYGKLNVSKVYSSVKYTAQEEQTSRSYKKGQIGTGNPTLDMKLSNKYSDIKIK